MTAGIDGCTHGRRSGWQVAGPCSATERHHLLSGGWAQAASAVLSAYWGITRTHELASCLQVALMQQLKELQQQQGPTPHLLRLVSLPDESTLVLSPFCQPLLATEAAVVCAQVGADLAAILGWLIRRRILQRDVSSGNIATTQLKGAKRGVLLDFSAAKVRRQTTSWAWPL
jgi:hypothetical protein